MMTQEQMVAAAFKALLKKHELEIEPFGFSRHMEKFQNWGFEKSLKAIEFFYDTTKFG